MLCTMLSSIRCATPHMLCYTLENTEIMQDYTPCATISYYYYYMHYYKLKGFNTRYATCYATGYTPCLKG